MARIEGFKLSLKSSLKARINGNFAKRKRGIMETLPIGKIAIYSPEAMSQAAKSKTI